MPSNEDLIQWEIDRGNVPWAQAEHRKIPGALPGEEDLPVTQRSVAVGVSHRPDYAKLAEAGEWLRKMAELQSRSDKEAEFHAMADAVQACAADLAAAEKERDEAQQALARRDTYSRKTGCDCHETNLERMCPRCGNFPGVADPHKWACSDCWEALPTDPDYSPAYQDEYQRLWHVAAADRDRLAAALEPLAQNTWTLPLVPDGMYSLVFTGKTILRAREALAQASQEQPK